MIDYFLLNLQRINSLHLHSLAEIFQLKIKLREDNTEIFYFIIKDSLHWSLYISVLIKKKKWLDNKTFFYISFGAGVKIKILWVKT